MLQTRVVGKIKTHFVFDTLFYENRAVYEIMHCRAAQATDENMTHVHCMLDT